MHFRVSGMFFLVAAVHFLETSMFTGILMAKCLHKNSISLSFLINFLLNPKNFVSYIFLFNKIFYKILKRFNIFYNFGAIKNILL